MHIPDGFLSGPINGALACASVAVCGVATWRARSTLGEKQVPMLGMAGAFIFAVQMLNFPVAGGTSGHFLGATMAALLLGPLNACLVMALVLAVQCFLFADGGMTALGANIFNMGVVGALCGGVLHRVIRTVLPRTRGAFLGAAFAVSWLSVVGGAAACSFELAFSGTVPLKVVLPAMLGVHAIIGLGEGLITCAVLAVVLGARPDLVVAWPRAAEAA